MKLTILIVFLLVIGGAGFSQPMERGCRKIEISTPSGYLQKGGTHYISAVVHDYHPEAPELLYRWTLPTIPRFTILDNGFGASFVASEDLHGLVVTVVLQTQEKNGACKSEVSASFEILFNPGTPLMLDEYQRLSFQDEKERLDSLASELKGKDHGALFVVRYKPTDTKASLVTRVNRIITHLLTRGVPRNRLYFAFLETDRQGAMIYAYPTKELKVIDPIPEIGKLDIPRRTKTNRQR